MTEREIREELRRINGPFIFDNRIKVAKNERPHDPIKFLFFSGFFVFGLVFFQFKKLTKK